MYHFEEKYINPFTDEDSLKYYRDLKNSLDTAREEGIEIGIEKGIESEFRQALIDNNAYFMSPEEILKVEKVAFDVEKDVMKVDVVGKSVLTIANLAGINVPENTSVLIAPLENVGKEYPLSNEILAPILAYYVEDDFQSAVNRCIDLNYHGGIGHTASIFSNDEDKIKQFSLIMNAGRIVVNMPSSQGAVGLGSGLNPSLTLGCGTGGKNITTDNITATHLLNIQRIARRKENFLYDRFDKSKYLDENFDSNNLEIDYYINK